MIPTEYRDGHSDQLSHPRYLTSNSQPMGVSPRNGQNIQVTVGTTVDVDLGFIDLNNTVSSGVGGEEGGSYSERQKKKNMEA
jgi:hypothetical protein